MVKEVDTYLVRWKAKRAVSTLMWFRFLESDNPGKKEALERLGEILETVISLMAVIAPGWDEI